MNLLNFLRFSMKQVSETQCTNILVFDIFATFMSFVARNIQETATFVKTAYSDFCTLLFRRFAPLI